MAARICCHAGPEFETVAGCLKEGDREATPRAGLKGSKCIHTLRWRARSAGFLTGDLPRAMLALSAAPSFRIIAKQQAANRLLQDP